MSIEQVEKAEIFPLNPPADGVYGFRKGFPIIQFQIANQDKFLNPQTLRLNVGRMLQHFVNVMHNAGRGGGVDDGVDKVAGDPSMVLYSGHDWTLMPLLMVLI